ncbi:ATP-binding cassette domain-containing protein [Svornostia abyssi]|uniref:ATP-binding cassette domain-containing protein n=1 Tax=Svornostia abyssi TaxID=2898438 RepID=A0ABY5PFJ7_9ACTN|nr:ATP-binding cassette domain-containing protein [Parviterribacteraceae bacterium J379]
MQSQTTARGPAAVTAPGDDARATQAVDLREVRHAFGALIVLDGISLAMRPGETVALVGPSGCGKSTLLELVCGLQAPDGGSVAAAPAALVPQRDALLPWADALDNAALPLRLQGTRRADARRRAAPLLAELGLAGFEHAKPHELSGGMRQRVAFVRALLTGRGLLCLDEPFGALDALTRADMHRWLSDALAAEPRTVLLVTHDIEEALVLADRVCVLSPRPARIVCELAVPGDCPRDPADHELVELRRQAMEALRAC